MKSEHDILHISGRAGTRLIANLFSLHVLSLAIHRIISHCSAQFANLDLLSVCPEAHERVGDNNLFQVV